MQDLCHQQYKLSKDPEWLRQDSSGLRVNAEVEFVIDLQIAALDGLRLFETRAGALETPDWISNKYLVYAYKRGSAEPIWANPAYPAFRLHVDKALDAWDKDGTTPGFNKSPTRIYPPACNLLVTYLGL